MPGPVRVVLNCAVSRDLKVANPDGTPLRLSDTEDLRRVHALRVACDAILVGVGTVLADDPALRVKPEYAPSDWTGRQPVRVVLDTAGRAPPNARVFDGLSPTVVATGPDAPAPPPPSGTLRLALRDGRIDLAALLQALAARGIKTVLVEGGPSVLRSFVEAKLVDQWTVFVAPLTVGGNGPALWQGALAGTGDRPRVLHRVPFGSGELVTLEPKPPRLPARPDPKHRLPAPR